MTARPDVVSAEASFSREPALEVVAPDGARLAVFRVRAAPDDPRTGVGPPLLLVHGASADHTTFRVVGPILARARDVFAMDRRGRGASSDGGPYSIEREYEDVGVVTEALAAIMPGTHRGHPSPNPGRSSAGSPGEGPPSPFTAVDVLGHSYGGRCALGAALRSRAIRRVVAYEGAPVPRGTSYRPDGLIDAMRALLAAGDPAGALQLFLARVVGMTPDGIEAYHREAVWPARVAAAHTILREIESEASRAGSVEALAGVAVPVLLILGSISRPPFRIGTEALAARLANVEVAVIAGAAHAAHHTHPAEFVAIVERFLDRPDAPDGDGLHPGLP